MDYNKVLRELEEKQRRQQSALDATTEHIELIRQLKQKDTNTKASANTK